MTTAMDTVHFSPYRADGKLYGFVCVVTGAQQPVGQAIIKELAGRSLNDNCRSFVERAIAGRSKSTFYLMFQTQMRSC